MRMACRLLFLTIILTAFSFQARAVDVPVVVAKLEGSASQLVVGAQTATNIYTDLPYASFASVNRIRNVVTFKINEESPVFFSSAFTATLTYKIYFEDAYAVSDSTAELSLTINYDTSSTYTQQASFQFFGGYKATVKIINISATAAVLSALVLLNEMHANVDFNFSCTNDTVTGLGYNGAFTTADELYVSWGAANGADEYDLEWAYIDSTALDYYKVGGALNFRLIYENNASRVTVSGLSYNIPLLYDYGGVVFFRVRGIQNKASGRRRIEGSWSWGGHGIYGFYGHQRNFNWQATTSYAEEGRRKSVVQYFDGTLRARQTVTKDNSLGTTIVAETFYDYQGRPTINVLPAPTLNTIIQYTQNFNVDYNGAEYDKSEYDSLTHPSYYCSAYAPPMGTQSGAALYYSNGNPELNNGMHKYIPDAYGQAFVETQYTPDNTGRISRQSGVGAYHHLGSGHETIYNYGLPSQKELDGLFGTEVGHFTHYQKNMVRDANGQYSVSYVDMNGRTIATALAGQAPDGIEPLSSNLPITVTEPLITPASNHTDGLSLIASKGMLVPKAGPHRFMYTLTPDSITLANCGAVNICYDCYYDLEITITNECNNNGFPGNAPIVIRRTNLTLASLDTLCNNAPIMLPAVDTTIQLEEGSYLVTKKLTVSRWAMEYYRDSVFLRNNVCKTKEDFVREVLDSLRLQPTDCTPECASCLTSVGTWLDFHASYMTQSGYAISDTANYRSEAWKAYHNALDACAALCNSIGDDATIRKAMLWDVSPPSGQYAIPQLDSLNNSFSIFKVVGSTRQYADPLLVYRDENGKLDTVIVNSVPTLPNNLSWEEFTTYFKKSWAETLLPLHPEFCKLQKYEQYSESHAWDVRFEAVETYQAALDSGFLNPTASVLSPFSQYLAGSDPLFNNSYTLGGNSLKVLMESNMLNFQQIDNANHISMWALATLTAVCKPNETTCANTYKDDDYAFDTNTLCEGELDMAWRSFRSFYMTKKRALIRQLIDSCGAINLGYYQSRFIDPAGYLTNPSNSNQAASDAQAAMAEHFVTTCEAYADQWVHELSKCSAYNIDSLRAHVIPKLIQVCIKGSDATHLYGSSTISPDSAYQFNSFEAVIEWYNNSISLDSANRNICNNYLITAPKPYNQSTVYSEIPVWNKPDSCICEKIEELYTDYQTNNSHYSTFSAYLQAVHKTIISQGALDTLRGLCSDAITCNYLASPISLPAALQCGVSNVCIDCEQMRNGYEAYLQRFPGSYPGVDTTGTDSVQHQVNTVFANFLNAQFGFSYSAAQYLAFMQNCKIGVSAYQDTLWRRIADFKDYYRSTPRNQIWRTWKLTPLANSYIRSLNVLLKANQNPSAPKLPSDFALRPFTTSLDAKMKSVIKTLPNIPSDSMFHVINPFPLQYSMDHSSWEPGFVHLTTNVVKPSDFVTGTATFTELKDRYFAVATSLRWNFIHNIWVGTGNPGAFTWYGMSTPDSNFIPKASGFYSWENHIQSVAFYKPGLSVVDSTTYLTQYIDSVWAGTWWGDYANNTVYINQIKEIKNLRFDPMVLPLADMYQFDWHPAGLKVTLDLRSGGSMDAYIFQTYAAPHIKWKEAIDSSLYHPDCKTAFANFFNQRSDSTYTTAQIDAILTSNGIVFNYCDTAADTTKLLCGKTEVFKSFDLDGSNCNDSTELALTWGTELYNAYRDSLKNAFEAAYLKKCMAAFNHESFTVTRPHSEYHYTLYYYDQAGNLVQTVPPAGVYNRIDDATFLANVTSNRASGTVLRPGHTMATNYRYNTLNQVVAQLSPDGGESQFWYDRLGRLAISQNAKQVENEAFSYTLYDGLGRIHEVGELLGNNYMDDDISRNAVMLHNWVNSGDKRQITRTTYDAPNTLIEPELYQKNLRNRVSYTEYVAADGEPYQSATYYSYDIHGNVDTLVQDYQAGLGDWGHRFKKMVYRYDLISGKVNHVAYQPGRRDQFYHRYEYDAENKLTHVYTSRDSVHWERDASYSYYKHGPLARTELGQQRVQGIDYAYTIQGWLKGVNGTLLCDGSNDMGQDGYINGESKDVAQDAYGFALHYFNEDYRAIGHESKFYGLYSRAEDRINEQSDYRPLFNGNISAMSVNIGKLNMPAIYNYRYDQLNRLRGMDFIFAQNVCEDPLAELWDSELQRDHSYEEEMDYDANGNVLYYRRNANATYSSLQMDDLNYKYIGGTNKLDQIVDVVDPGFDFDIDDQNTHNYQYDAIGNLVYDEQSYIDNIEWTVYGKIKAIYKNGSDPNGVQEIHYTYDASGNRISKYVYNVNTGEHYTWYVRDASGNVMAVYEYSGENPALHLTERHLYGSSRLGIEKPQINMDTEGPDAVWMGTLGEGYNFDFIRGQKFYELSNHLGNVLATISDKKIQHDDDSDGEVNWYEPYVMSAQDYYPFGMLMPGRQWNGAGSYRYGFNGQEMSNEIKGEGNSYTAGFWEYDPRAGRRWNLDPRPIPGVSPYSCFAGNPIWFTDHLGDTIRAYSDKTGEFLGATYGEGKNYALVVSEDKEQHVKQLLKGNDQQKFDKFKQSLIESQLVGIPYIVSYGTFYDVGAMFDFYDDYGLKYEATSFSVKSQKGYVSIKDDLLSATLNGKKVNLKTFAPKGAEVEGNLVYKNGVVTMGLPENYRTSNSLNSQSNPVPQELNVVSSIHTHPGIFFDLLYKTKAAGNAHQFRLHIIPNIEPSDSDFKLGNQPPAVRLAVVSSGTLYLYNNNTSNMIKVDRQIK